MWYVLLLVSVASCVSESIWPVENRILQLRTAAPRSDSPPSYMVHLYNRYRKGRMPYSAANTIQRPMKETHIHANGYESIYLASPKYHTLHTFTSGGRGRLVVKASERGWRVISSSPVPLLIRRVGHRCMLNMSRAQTSSRWCGS
ncbi:hypothetical protein TNCV_3042431 [Trichonephila clavipes]|nr:hypothetical protein TNCV_3042431 [Trichonephila clavipes]